MKEVSRESPKMDQNSQSHITAYGKVCRGEIRVTPLVVRGKSGKMGSRK